MDKAVSNEPAQAAPATPRDWVMVLAKYRDPSYLRSAFELGVSLVPFFALWAAAIWALTFSYWLAFAIALANGVFLVRLFVIQHDCGHRSFFKSQRIGDWVGRAIGTLTLTPYDVWRHTHSVHHASSGNLDRRGMGDVMTLTYREYRSKSRWGRFGYRLYRNPFVLFGLGPIYLFYVQNRLPVGLMRAGARFWTSAMGTNIAVGLTLGLLLYFGGLMTVLLIFVPTTLVGAAIGLWMFYVQHQFEKSHWDTNENWQLHDAALQGSSHYALPAVLQWLTANIGIHHVHHLYSRIPCYRLTEVLRDHPVLASMQRLTFVESFACANLRFWDEKRRRMMSYAEARNLYGQL